MKKILKIWDNTAEWLCEFGAERWVHFVAGLMIAFFVALADVEIWNREGVIAFSTGFLTACFIAPLKEICDFFRGERFDMGDVFFTVLGGFFGAFMLYLTV